MHNPTRLLSSLPSCSTQWLSLALAALWVAPTSLLAEGFRNPPPGAFNLGRAGGRIAHVDDASAVTQNPANLTDLQSSQLLVAPSFVRIQAEFKSSSTGQKAKTEEPWKALPNLFVAIPWPDQPLVFGLGVTAPYGISQNWEEDRGAFAPMTGVLRYNAPHFAELKTIQINPSVAMSFADRVRVGAGLDVMWSELTLKQFYPWLAFPAFSPLTAGDPDGTAKLKGQGVGLGANFGVTWQITPRQRMAATVRTPIRVEYDGDFDISHVPARAGAFGVTSQSDFSTKITFPTIIGLGYGLQVTDRVRLELDVEYLEFSKFESLNLKVGNNALLFPSTDIRQDWDDTFTVGLGADWQVTPSWVLRGGYQFYESPVPSSTLAPTIPDGNQHVFTFGIHYRIGHHRLEAAYGLDFYDERHIRNSRVDPAFHGDYTTRVHLFALQYGYTF